MYFLRNLGNLGNSALKLRYHIYTCTHITIWSHFPSCKRHLLLLWQPSWLMFPYWYHTTHCVCCDYRQRRSRRSASPPWWSLLQKMELISHEARPRERERRQFSIRRFQIWEWASVGADFLGSERKRTDLLQKMSVIWVLFVHLNSLRQ